MKDDIYFKRPFKVGTWYFNPLMEKHGIIRCRWVRIRSIEDRYTDALHLIFDMGIFPNGEVHEPDFTFGAPYTQSNGEYEAQMREATPEELKWINIKVTSNRFGL